MNILNFRILNSHPIVINFPNNRNVIITSQTDWSDNILHSVNATITYSIVGNTSDILFNDGSAIHLVTHQLNSNPCFTRDTLSFIVRGTNPSPANQFVLRATVEIQKKTLTDLITIVLT